MTTAAPIPLSFYDHDSLQQVREAEPKLHDHLAALLACKNLKEGLFSDDDALEIHSDDSESNVVKVKYAGTTIRFQLIVGVNSAGAVVGRMIVSHQFLVHGKTHYRYLGEFEYATNGRTNFADHSGRICYIQPASDLIIAHYLRMAFEHNLTINPSELTD